jgi:iron(III) transport system permease protein
VVGNLALIGHIVVLLALVAVPGYAVVRAVQEPGGPSLGAVIAAQRWRLLTKNTAVVGSVAACAAVGLGTLFGVLLARTDMPGRRLLSAAAILGACLPIYVTAVFFFALVPVWRYANSALACGVIQGLLCVPLATVILTAALRAADRDLEDNARLDAGQWRVLWRVTIPQAAWGIALTILIVVLIVATDFTVADLLVVRTFAEEVYSQYALHGSAAGPVLAAVPVLAALALLLGLIQARYRLLGEHSPWQFGVPPREVVLGRWRWVAGVACFAVLAVTVGVPAAALVRKVGSVVQMAKLVVDLRRELVISVCGALTAALLVVALGVGLAWSAARTRRLRWIVLAGVILLLAAPAPVVGISLIDLFNRPGRLGAIYDSPAIMVLGYFVRFLPLGCVLLIPAVRRVPQETEAAACIDGCDWRGVQWHVYWPAVFPDVLFVGLVIMILCFGEIGTTVLLAPPAWPPAAVRAFTLLHFGVYQDLAVLALATVACILVPWLLILWVSRRRRSPACTLARQSAYAREQVQG